MSTRSKISVTLSNELLDHLRLQSQRLHVPLKWLVAGLVVDTSECVSGDAMADERTDRWQRSLAYAV